MKEENWLKSTKQEIAYKNSFSQTHIWLLGSSEYQWKLKNENLARDVTDTSP